MQQTNLELVENGKKSGGVKTAQQISVPPYPDASATSFSAVTTRLLRCFDYIAILRPLLLMPAWTMLLLGYYNGVGKKLVAAQSMTTIGGMPVIWRPDGKILITLLLYSLLMGAVYILNQISDSHTDEINGKLHLVAQGYMKERTLKIQAGILLLASALAAFLKFPSTYVYLILLSMILGVLYSVPPVRLKGKPILDLLANAAGFGLVAFAVGWTSSTTFSMDIILKCSPYVLCISAAFINTTIPDMRGDRQNGDITTGIFLGIRNSCIVSTILVGSVPLVSLLLGDFICLTASVLSLPFFIYMTISNWDEQSPNFSAINLATKVSLMLLSLLIAIFIPLYFVLLIITLLLMKLYYQMRFGISYP